MANNMKSLIGSNEDQQTIRRILQTSGEIYSIIKLTVPAEWLASNMTVAQLRILLLLFSEGPMRMTDIAAVLDIKVATATGIVNNLVDKGFVLRKEDPQDRRSVICSLSSAGKSTINKMWALGKSKMELLLRGLTTEQLKKAEEVAGFLLVNIKSKEPN
jgi:DNA-binding MarR family transcriptional regulator